MLKIRIEEQEFYNQQKEMFFYTRPVSLSMEHSLISVAKWESFWEKPYLSSVSNQHGYSMSPVEYRHYICCMIIGESYDEYIPDVLMANHIQEIRAYIEKKHSATTIYRKGSQSPSRKVITAELIYYWMTELNIPFDCDKWHLNRLLTLIEVCNVKRDSGKSDKMSARDAANYRHNLNKARRSGAKI